MRQNKFFNGIFYWLLLVLLSGCATLPQSRSYNKSLGVNAPLDVASMLRFNDIPVPSGFTIIEGESFAFQNNVTRVALLKYLGPRNADLVVEFYKDQMPMYNWSPINIIEYERRILNYEKESESCIVTVEAKGRKSFVVIAISPKSRPMKVSSEK